MTVEPTTTINFIANINEKTSGLLLYLLNDQLKSGVTKYRLNISSRGGDVFHAISIYNFTNGMKNVEVHTHNIGQIDSAANLIFVAGHKKTASKASTFLMHPPEMTVQGQGILSFSIELIKERLESIKKDEERMANIIAGKTNKSADDVLDMFKKRETYSSDQALERGLIDGIEEFTAEPNKPIFMITNQA